MLKQSDSENLLTTDLPSDSSSYRIYPAHKPFINTEWTRNHQQPLSKAFPETNRDLIMNSLKMLQQKLNNLEIERKSSEHTLMMAPSSSLSNGQNNSNNNDRPNEMTTIHMRRAGPLTTNNNKYENSDASLNMDNNNSRHQHSSNHFNNNNNNQGSFNKRQSAGHSSISNSPTNHFVESELLFKRVSLSDDKSDANNVNNNNMDWKTLNTEKRIAELEKQLEQMKRMLVEHSAYSYQPIPTKNSNINNYIDVNDNNNNNNHNYDNENYNLHEDNHNYINNNDNNNNNEFIDDQASNERFLRRSNNFESDATLRDCDQVLSNEDIRNYKERNEQKEKLRSFKRPVHRKDKYELKHNVVRNSYQIDKDKIDEGVVIDEEEPAEREPEPEPEPEPELEPEHEPQIEIVDDLDSNHGHHRHHSNRHEKASYSNRSRSADHVPLTTTTMPAACSRGPNHYRLNLGDIPFMVGKSTTPSHHLGTNIQNVISLLKQHHPNLCGMISRSGRAHLIDSFSHCNNATTRTKNQSNNNNNNRSVRQNENQEKQMTKLLKRSKSTPSNPKQNRSINLINEEKKSKIGGSLTQPVSLLPPPSPSLAPSLPPPPASLPQTPPTANRSSRVTNLKEEYETNSQPSSKSPSFGHYDWDEVLRILQEDYTHLVLQHYDITKKIVNSLDVGLRNEYELEADRLHRKMKIKARQINKLRAYRRYKLMKKNHYETTYDNQNENELFKSNTSNNYYYSDHQQQQQQQQQHAGASMNTQLLSTPKTPITTNTTNTSHLLYNLDNSYLNRSAGAAAAYNNLNNQQNHSKNLKLFKDIKNLQLKIQNDDFKF